MEYFIGFIIQLAGILLIVKVCWSFVRLTLKQVSRATASVFSAAKRAFKPKRRPMAVPKAPGMPRLTSAFYPEPQQFDMALLEIPTYLRRQSVMPTSAVATACTEFN